MFLSLLYELTAVGTTDCVDWQQQCFLSNCVLPVIKVLLLLKKKNCAAQVAAIVGVKDYPVGALVSKQKRAIQHHIDHTVSNEHLRWVLPIIIAILWVDTDRAGREAMFAKKGEIHQALTVNSAQAILVVLKKPQPQKGLKKPKLVRFILDALLEKLEEKNPGLWCG